MDVSYIAKRITELRLARNISEYQMSLELGQSKSYVQSITSGKNLPSVHQLFNIADYFNMTLAEFFDEGYHLLNFRKQSMLYGVSVTMTLR